VTDSSPASTIYAAPSILASVPPAFQTRVCSSKKPGPSGFLDLGKRQVVERMNANAGTANAGIVGAAAAPGPAKGADLHPVPGSG